ncbi:hypothetical protein [Acidipropionibacterium virtanenii]|uniref:Uncharacterized protein n=1 Tax=Acidipropionibacterium virtanenii TaxID=2057246 RepID=A0A344UXH7_9ACTN|nr:hypothetical protein [Acidipropionibacterium virtanenii]AXE39975.1 hypothetical protein JS278_02840 [Acidipropionibacterium virtanenii]
MNQDFKKVVTFLYQEFGDQGIAWVKEQVAAHGSDASPAADGKGASPVPQVEVPTEDDAAFEDGAAFSAGVMADVKELADDTIKDPTQVVDAVLGLVMMAGEVRKFEEVQVTKRVGIAAQRDIAIANIRAQQDLLQNYLDRSFDERSENFNRLFSVVDDALETNNMAALAMGLESVVKLATSSPFKDLRSVEETAAALTDPNHEWDF